jgi:signal transduction histidine kinase
MHYRDQPIARKALTLGIVPTACALSIVAVAFGVAMFLSLRTNLTRDSDALVAIVADNISAAVGFNDPATATELLRGLRAKDSIDKVCVYDAAGRLFAAYALPGQTCSVSDLAGASSPAAASVFTQPVAVGGRRVGSVHLFSNTTTLNARIQTLAALTGAALLFGALIAWVLAERMQRSISRPIVALATVADKVSRTRDYSLRAEKTTADEVGQMVTAFNGMLAQVERQDRIKDEFLATLSHELRTPLNAMLGWLQILQKTHPDEKTTQRALASLERNARSQHRVVEDLLDISRIVTGKLQMSSEVVDLRSVVSSSLEVASVSARERQVALSATTPPTPCLVSGDSVRLQQAIWNLLANSVKFTPPGGSIELDLSETGPDYVLRVTDSGVGIDPAFLPRVFDRFQQADSSLTREHGGLGLGLALVKEIAALHGGTIAATSPGLHMGATFTLTLPRLVHATSDSVEPIAQRAVASPSGRAVPEV